MSTVGSIITGTVNNLLNREEELFEERIKICRQCKLLIVDSFFGEMCNHNLWLNPVTDDLSYFHKDGYFKGCGCILGSKCRVLKDKCPANKW